MELVAYIQASFTGVGPVPYTFGNEYLCQAGYSGVGHFTGTMATGMGGAEAEIVPTVTVLSDPAFVSFEWLNDHTFQVRLYDTLGAPKEVDRLWIAVHRIARI